MIETLPAAASAALKQNVPLLAASKVKFWWVRGIVLDVQQAERPTPKPEKDNPHGRLRDLVVKIGDVDRTRDGFDGYDVRLEGAEHEVQVGDVVSLLGHELKDAQQVTTPRLFLNHNTGAFTRAYPVVTRLPYGFVPIFQHKEWLSARLPVASPLWVSAAASFGLYIALPLLLLAIIINIALSRSLLGLVLLSYLYLGALLAIPAGFAYVLVLLYRNWINAQPLFTFERKLPMILVQNIRDFIGYSSHDMTPAYERLAAVIHAEVLQNPAPELDFVPVARGVHTVGLLGGQAASTPPVDTSSGDATPTPI